MKNVVLIALFALFFAGVGPTEATQAKKTSEIEGKKKVYFCESNATTYHSSKTCTELSGCESIVTNSKKYAKKKGLSKCSVCF